MATPLDIDERDESEGAQRISNNQWYWVALALVVMILALVLLARSGAGANGGSVASDASNIQAAGRTNGTTSPNVPKRPPP